MRLLHARLLCGYCGEEMTATIPLVALGSLMDCCVCGQKTVLAYPGGSALPIPKTSEIAMFWHLNVAAEPYLVRTGGRWAQA